MASRARKGLVTLGDQSILFAAAVRGIFRRPFYLAEFLEQCRFILGACFVPLLLTGLGWGTIVALEAGNFFKLASAEWRIGGFMVLANVREFAPVATGLMVAAALTDRGARRVVVPAGLDLLALPAGTEAVPDDGLTPPDLDGLDGVITGAAVAIAETGTIVLDGSPDQGRRAITLVPDYHLCIVHAAQVVELVPEAIDRLAPSAVRPLTWISGPSATSDIELSRVEGVHGPRTLEVILVDPP